MLLYLGLGILALAVLVISTDQFVSGAGTVARESRVSPVLVGAVILGCGTGLPELALTFYAPHESPFRQLLGNPDPSTMSVGSTIALLIFVLLFSLPMLFPHRIGRHSPMIMAATIGFSALLRGSLDRLEAFAMIAGFIVGVGMIIHHEINKPVDPFAPLVDDDKYFRYNGYLNTPRMSHSQKALTRCFAGFLGTAVGAEAMAISSTKILEATRASELFRNLVFVGLASLLPHVVVAFQATRRRQWGLAVGNLIGANLFNSLVIGGSLALIRPYQYQNGASLRMFGVMLCTALLTWLLLHTTRDEITRRGAIGMFFAYSFLVIFATV